MVGQPRSSQRYKTKVRDDEPKLLRRILDLVRSFPRYGYRFITAKLQQVGWQVNAQRVYRLWRREKLKVPRRKRKRRRLGSSVNGCDRCGPETMNDVWCWDFIFDHTTSGSQLKWLSIVDESTRKCLCLKVDHSITCEDVPDTLAELFAMRGVPKHIRSDNGSEFNARAIRSWLGKLGIQALYIEPGSPWDSGYAESFHSRLRDEFLGLEMFENLAAARRLTAQSKREQSEHRPLP